MSRRFKLLAIFSYGGVILSFTAVVLWILGFGQVGQCSSVDNTWDDCMRRTDFLGGMMFYPLLAAIITSTIAVFTRPLPGEKGKWAAASAFLIAPVFAAALIWMFMHLGIK